MGLPVNRDRHEIAIAILKKSKGGRNKTELMREVNLSYAQSKQYLKVLIEKGLLLLDANSKYVTTDKGLEFVEKCESCPLFKWA